MTSKDSGFVPAHKGHRIAPGVRGFCRYTVYDNRSDLPIIIDGTSEQCARALKISLNSFYCMVSRARIGKVKQYSVLCRTADEEDIDVC